MTDLPRLSSLVKKLNDIEEQIVDLGQQIDKLADQEESLKGEGLEVLSEIESIHRARRRELEVSSRTGPSRKYGGMIEAVMDTLASDPNRVWTNAEIASAIYKAPAREQRMKVNSALIRLAHTGRLLRSEAGKYSVVQ